MLDVAALGTWLLESPVPFCVVDSRGTVRALSEGAARLLGRARADVVGDVFISLLPSRYSDDRKLRVQRSLIESAARDDIVEHVLETSQGVEVPVEVRVSRFEDGIALVLTDLSPQQALQDELLRLASFPELSPAPCIEVDQISGAVVYGNAPANEALADPAFCDGVVAALGETEMAVREVAAAGRVWSQRLTRVDAWDRIRIYAEDVTELSEARDRLRAAKRDLEARVRERTQELAEINMRLLSEVEIRARAEEAALEASRAKSSFLANMSHELRTPLNAIIGYSELLLEEAPSDLQQDLAKIHGSARHLLELISNVLDLSKIEAGRMDVYAEPVEPHTIAAAVRTSIEPLAMANGNTLHIDVEPDLGVLKTDVVKVRQILMNLLSNAAKFTRDGDVGLRIRREEDWTRFDVWDTGIGMTEEQLERVYQSFTQADGSTTRRFGGTGLGLSISREFARILGGELSATSTPGEGTTFTLRLPAEEPSSATVTPSPLDAAGGELILIVDDDPAVRELLERTLTAEGYRVAAAHNGSVGLASVRALQPAVVLLDVLMPELDGWSVLASLKADPELARVPVVLHTMVDERARGISLGAAEYFLKPVDRGVLVETVAGLCGERPGTLLVVDDDPATRELVRRALGGQGWTVAEATNGREALDYLEHHTPLVVLLDLMMPDVDGFEVLTQMKASERLSEVPIVVLTAMTLGDGDLERLRGRVESLLLKGALGTDALLEEIRQAVRRCVQKKPVREAGG